MKTDEFVKKMLSVNHAEYEAAMRRHRLAMKDWRRCRDAKFLDKAAKALADAGAVYGIALGEDTKDCKED